LGCGELPKLYKNKKNNGILQRPLGAEISRRTRYFISEEKDGHAEEGN